MSFIAGAKLTDNMLRNVKRPFSHASVKEKLYNGNKLKETGNILNENALRRAL